MSDYFAGCRTPEELRQRHRALSRRLHPDAGGDARQFAEMTDEYRHRLDEMAKEAERAGDGETLRQVADMVASTLKAVAPGVASTIKSYAAAIDAVVNSAAAKTLGDIISKL